MTQHIKAIYEHGVLRPLAPLDLKELAIVSLAIDSAESGHGATVAASGAVDAGGEHGPTLFDVLQDAGLIGCINDAPADLSTNPSHLEGFGEGGA